VDENPTPAVVVVDLGAPMFKHLAWFIDDAGVAVAYSAESLDDVVALLERRSAAAVVLNTARSSKSVARAVDCLHASAPQVAVVAFEDEPGQASAAELGITRPCDVGDVIEPLRKLLEADLAA
jgi:hypothetical protein